MARTGVGECVVAALVWCIGGAALVGADSVASMKSCASLALGCHSKDSSLLQLRQRMERTRSGSPDFQPVNPGYLGEACRGETSEDNNASYYTLISHVETAELCQESCRSDAACHGIEYYGSHHRCELWTRAEGIGASYALDGVVCLRHTFQPVDGGADRACRGASPADNSPSYYDVLSGVDSLALCKERCEQAEVCKGIEYSSGRCEVWTRDGGISATLTLPGYTCQRYNPSSVTTTTTASTTLSCDQQYLNCKEDWNNHWYFCGMQKAMCDLDLTCNGNLQDCQQAVAEKDCEGTCAGGAGEDHTECMNSCRSEEECDADMEKCMNSLFEFKSTGVLGH